MKTHQDKVLEDMEAPFNEESEAIIDEIVGNDCKPLHILPPNSAADTKSNMSMEFYNALDNVEDEHDHKYVEGGEASEQEQDEDKSDSKLDKPVSEALAAKKMKKTGIDHAAWLLKLNARKKVDPPGLSKDWQKCIMGCRSAPPTKPTHEELAMVKVKIENIKVKASTNVLITPNISYCKMPVSCLPFPQDGIQGQDCAMKWKKEFKATAIDFAGSQQQPFTTNALLHDHIKTWWDKVFEFSITDHWSWTAKPGDALPAVVEQ
ncbi:hypothetical protein H0H87_010056, partial [Tephrocybe sp. NHM501043]